MARSGTSDRERREIVAALDRAGIPSRARANRHVDVEGERLRLVPVRMAVATPAAITRLGSAPDDAVGIVIADRISAAARAELNERGWSWLDRRGHLRLWTPRTRVDVDIEPVAVARAADRFASPFPRVGIEIALALLKEPEREWTVSELAARLGRAPGGVSERLRALRDAGLVDAKNTPLRPELFWELVGPFHTRTHGLAEFPSDDFERLTWLGLPAEWCLTETRAAIELGAPVFASMDAPPEFYVPEAAIVDLALSHFGTARAQPAATVRVARYGGIIDAEPFARTPQGFAVAHPVVVALDLAHDRARGREIVEGWDPSDLGVTRVW
jgi:DNA-binding transcriptional ArsR family regulator